LIEYAEDLLAQGAWLFPLRTGTKIPAHKGWQEEATRDANRVRLWIASGFDLGLYTGRFGGVKPDGHYDALLAIDIDAKEERDG
jgi:hypothetical protein